jgi:hypothetical protein
MEPTDPPRKNYGLKPREFDRLNAPGKAPEKSIGHDVYAMLQQNRAAEQRAEIIEIKEVKSRRKRDYWLLLVPGTGSLALVAWLGRGNPYVLVFACSGIALLSLGLTWIMWFVMDDY